MSKLPSATALEILIERERREEVIVLLHLVLSLRLPNGKLALDRRDRRILYFYVLGYPQRAIAAKVGIAQQNVQKRINVMGEKVLRCEGGHLVNWNAFLEPPQSVLEAHVPEEKMKWNFDSAMKSHDGSYWGLTNRKKAWKTKEKCKVPEYFQDAFGCKVGCTYCGAKCTRKKVG